MSVTGEIKNLYSDKDKTRVLLPRTKTKAVSDENGTSLDVLLNEYRDYTKKVGNPQNLLDNSYFTNAVNQRRKTNADGGYFIDRWLGYKANLTTEGISLEIPSSGNAYIIQRLNPNLVSKLNGKFVTVAAMIDNIITAFSFQFFTNAQSYADGKYGLLCQTVPAGYTEIGIARNSGGTIKWMALYQGEYTAETLPEYQPKGYAVELAECMRYYRQSNLGHMIVDNAWSGAGERFEPKMRITPTITIYDENGNANAVSSWGLHDSVNCNPIETSVEGFNIWSDQQFTDGTAYYYKYTASADL